MKVTKRHLRKIIRETLIREYGVGGAAAAGPDKDRPYIDIAMDYLPAGDVEGAASAILDSFMMDDTWAKEEMALEDMLRALGASPTPDDVHAVAEEWYAGYKAGEYSPAEGEEEAQWKLGAERSRARAEKDRPKWDAHWRAQRK